MMESELEKLLLQANEKILLGKDLIENLECYKNIAGVQKIQRKINQEIKFLQKVTTSKTIKINHVMCSNLTHYEFLVKILRLQRDVIHVDCGFTVEHRNNPLRVDIVCENGLKWIKVIARNSKSLIDAAKGRASYGAKSILDQAEEFVDATEQHLCMFKKPKVVFYFSHEIENELLQNLKTIGVETASLSNIDAEDDDDIEKGTDLPNVSTLNLDVTTMLAYISSVTNGSASWIFEEPILTEQAEKERLNPLKPVLDKLFMGKRLICCETAYNSFQNIISLLAGPSEIMRASKLLDIIDCLPDVIEIPEALSVIKYGGKIKPRSLKIFAFGMEMKSVTVTSNKAFIRSAKMQGINVPVFTHQARALTETKEQYAKPL